MVLTYKQQRLTKVSLLHTVNHKKVQSCGAMLPCAHCTQASKRIMQNGLAGIVHSKGRPVCSNGKQCQSRLDIAAHRYTDTKYRMPYEAALQCKQGKRLTLTLLLLQPGYHRWCSMKAMKTQYATMATIALSVIITQFWTVHSCCGGREWLSCFAAGLKLTTMPVVIAMISIVDFCNSK